MKKTTVINKRRIYFIDKEFQTRFILRFCAIVAIAGLLTVGVLYLLASNSTTVSIINSRIMVRTTSDFILPILIQTVVVVMIFASIATIAATLLFSHKIAGPLYRFKKTIQTLSGGDFSSDFQIRHSDQLQDLANDFNEMIRKVRKQLNILKADFVSLKKKLDGISEHEISDNKRPHLNELKKIAEDFDKLVDGFKS